ncbi:MAG TPA: response regulator [Clostridiales bacterium]|nr:response regulator [Clostridiales bacterium]
MSTTPSYKYIIVEDESLILNNTIKKIEALSLPLDLAGTATNGMDAQLLIDRVCPNLVITDIRMPQYNGIELARYINKCHPTIKTIVLTGYSDFRYAQSALKYGVKDYLLKPITPEALNTALQKLLISMDSEHQELTAISSEANPLNQETICELMEQYLCKNFNNEISLSEMADHFGFTIEYLGKIFKKFTGSTPSKYLTRLRLNEAKRLLVNQPELEIQMIAELVGYNDNFYFSRIFKSHTGIQPSEYRIANSNPDS